MSEERIKALEIGHAQLRRDLSDVAVSQKELYKQQAILDKSVNTLLIKLEDQINTERNFDSTIHHINSTVNSISLKLASGPMERHREIQEIVDPLFDNMRKQEQKFKECGEAIKTDLRKEAKSHLMIVWAGIIALTAMSLYILDDAKTDILSSQTENKIMLKEHMIHYEKFNKTLQKK